MTGSVSVIITSKDRPMYLAQAVESVLNQTHPVYEIIIVDDGSKNEFLERIDDIKKFSPIINLFYLQESRGPSYARNFALDKASGVFVIFLDDDDLIHPEMIASSLPLFNEKVDIVISWYACFFPPNDSPEQMNASLRAMPWETPPGFVRPVYQTCFEDLEMRPFHELLCYTHPIHSMLIRRRSLGNVRFPEDLRVGEDRYFFLDLAYQGCRFKCNRTINAFYRRHIGNQTCRDNYYQNLIKFHERLLSSKMLHDPEDIFFINSQIFLILLKQKSLKSAKYLIYMTRSPRYYPKYIALYLNLIIQKQLMARRIRMHVEA
ncbi:MAG: glycosyltransferase family 2 protein [Methanothrix sp.]|nr:glycosyltransferase family 2 protein [Methanothrix sp.]